MVPRLDKKVEPAAEEVRDTSLPRTGNKLDAIREQTGRLQPEKVAVNAGEAPNASWGEAHRLMALYLNGKLSAQQLAFKLKVHNSVVADTVIRDTKHDTARAIDMREVPREQMGKPGAGMQQNSKDQPAPRSAREAKAQARETDDDHKRAKLEREQKRIEQREQQRVIITANIFEREAQEIKGAHNLREVQRNEKERDENLLMEEKSQDAEGQYLNRHSKKASVMSKVRLFLRKLLKNPLELLQGGARQQDR